MRHLMSENVHDDKLAAQLPKQAQPDHGTEGEPQAFIGSQQSAAQAGLQEQLHERQEAEQAEGQHEKPAHVLLDPQNALLAPLIRVAPHRHLLARHFDLLDIGTVAVLSTSLGDEGHAVAHIVNKS